jgi:hypothetical protein
MRVQRLLHTGLVAAVAMVMAASGCQSCAPTSGTGAAKSDLQLVPKEADVLFMANLSRMRNTAMWRKLLDVRDSDPQSKKDYDDFVKKCQLDPLAQIDSVFVAFPQSTSQAADAIKEFAAILRGTFNEAKLVECAREQAKKDGQDVAISEYNGKKLYTSTKQGQAFAVFLDQKTVALAGKEWVKKVIDLSAGKGGGSAKDNEPLMALTKRARTSDGLWGAGLVPQATRDSLKNDPHLASAASMKDIFGSIDFANGFAADINVDLGSDADASDLRIKILAQLDDAKKNPQFMMLGLNTFLDNVKLEAKGPTFHVGINFNQPQVDDLINRVKGVLANFKSALGGGMGGGMPVPPPSPQTP